MGRLKHAAAEPAKLACGCNNVAATVSGRLEDEVRWVRDGLKTVPYRFRD